MIDTFGFRGVIADQLVHRFIDALGTKTAACRKNDDGVFRNAEHTPHFGFIGGKHFFGNGIAGQNQFFGRAVESFTRIFKADHHAIHVFGQHFACHTRHGVLLVNQGGNAHFCGRLDHRPAHIAARADDDVRLEFADDFFRLHDRSHRFDGGVDIGKRQLALEAAHLYGVKPVTGVRHKARFHAVGRADIFNHRTRIFGFNFIGNGKSRIDMTGRSAAADKHSHGIQAFLHGFGFDKIQYSIRRGKIPSKAVVSANSFRPTKSATPTAPRPFRQEES